ncbi:SRPBCC domain-containing protein [Parahaliea mediterranea]|uniref:SRPBCC domain-containing protein n=1 Tax=Parahaliea mediterranea TaxID=651086 RepID=A0A939DER6_9GAMM|nr:SRPBCC domain-containing protein [Parahaliea mediterranea]MBN7796719.1 SRPBCC domain-containing protein [Parahaliea mediterranea]
MIRGKTVSSDTVDIEAPASLVWEVLVDFAGYGQWNGFCPVAEAELALDAPIRMQVDLGFGLQEQVEYICRIEPERVVAWRMENRPGDPIHAVRTQTITPLGEHRCSYVSVDEFDGPGAEEMMATLAVPVEEGFNRCARDLKTHCESLYRERRTG